MNLIKNNLLNLMTFILKQYKYYKNKLKRQK